MIYCDHCFYLLMYFKIKKYNKCLFIIFIINKNRMGLIDLYFKSLVVFDTY